MPTQTKGVYVNPLTGKTHRSLQQPVQWHSDDISEDILEDSYWGQQWGQTAAPKQAAAPKAKRASSPARARSACAGLAADACVADALCKPYTSKTGKASCRVRANTLSGAPRKPRVYRDITKAEAEKAFADYYAANSVSYKGVSHPRFKNAKRAMTLDKNYTGEVIHDSRYLRNPHAFDFEGVDAGGKVRKVATPSAKQIAVRAAFAAARKNAALGPNGKRVALTKGFYSGL